MDFWIIKVHTSNWSSNSWGSSNSRDHRISGDHWIPLDHLSPYFHLKWSSNSKRPTRPIRASWKHPGKILKISWEHLKNIKRTSIEYLEKIMTSVIIWKHLWTSESIRAHLIIPIEYLINWGHPENIGLQLRTSENIPGTSVNIWFHPEKTCPHRGWLCIKVTTRLKTLENSWEHRKTSMEHLKTSNIILRTTEDPS